MPVFNLNCLKYFRLFFLLAIVVAADFSLVPSGQTHKHPVSVLITVWVEVGNSAVRIIAQE